MNTKAIGDISVSMALAALVKLGKSVLIPFGDKERYDLIFEDETGFRRVQCKTGHFKNGAVSFKTSSSYYHRGGTRKDYRGQADFFGVYCVENGKVYLIPVEESSNRETYLRVTPSLNNQIKRTRQAIHFEI